MKGDFSRNTFNPKKRYSTVRMQQGRVQLDADWNEQMDIIEYRHRIQTNDFIGVTGTPAKQAGFAISVVDDNGSKNNLLIGAGRYYINGLLCEKFENELVTTQTDLPSVSLPTDDGVYLAYLEAWQHSLNAADDPSILEAALNGADTTIRVKTLAQVKLINVQGNQTPSDPNAYLNAQLTSSNKGQLTAQLDPTYINLQNQLYRVEIHQTGDEKTATFKWSRNNAALSARIIDIQLGNATVIALDRMAQLSQLNLVNGQWLEIITEEQQLRNELGILVKLTAVNDYELTVTGWPANITDTSTLKNSVLRCWDMNNPIGAILIQPNVPIAIEDGLQIQFTPGSYQSGDYWMIPTRASNQLAWPSDEKNNPVPQLPFGINRYYTPLATLKRSNGQWAVQADCRYIFSSLADLQHSSAITIDPKAPAGSLSIDDQGNVKFKRNLATDAIKRIAPFYVRGTGLNRNTEDNYTLVKIGNQVIIDSSTEPKLPESPRGLYLCVINKADYTFTFKLYDTYISTSDTAGAEELAKALNAMTSQQIGILVSVNAWEAYLANVDANLIKVLQRLGLYRAAVIKNQQRTIRRPYAAIFVPSDQEGNSAKAVEILQSSDASAPYAELSGWLLDGSFVANGSSTPNALSYYVGTPPAVAVDENNVTTINSLNVNNVIPAGAFSVTPAPNKIPIADSSGLINSDWLGNYWLTPPTSMPLGRRFFCSVLMGDEIYILGGIDLKNNLITRVDVYNIKTNSWSNKKDIKSGRCAFAAVALNGKIYLIGGFSKSDRQVRNDIEIYDPSTGGSLSSQTINGRAHLSATLINDTIYIIGGINDHGDYLNVIQGYTPATNTIKNEINLTNGRCDHCSVGIDNKIYIIGGWGGKPNDDASHSFEVYDPGANAIKAYPLNFQQLNLPRHYFGAAAVNGKVYIFGGTTSLSDDGDIPEVVIFDPYNDQFGKVITTLPARRLRYGLDVVSVNNRIYVFGGGPSEVDVYVCAS